MCALKETSGCTRPSRRGPRGTPPSPRPPPKAFHRMCPHFPDVSNSPGQRCWMGWRGPAAGMREASRLNGVIRLHLPTPVRHEDAPLSTRQHVLAVRRQKGGGGGGNTVRGGETIGYAPRSHLSAGRWAGANAGRDEGGPRHQAARGRATCPSLPFAVSQVSHSSDDAVSIKGGHAEPPRTNSGG